MSEAAFNTCASAVCAVVLTAIGALFVVGALSGITLAIRAVWREISGRSN